MYHRMNQEVINLPMDYVFCTRRKYCLAARFASLLTEFMHIKKNMCLSVWGRSARPQVEALRCHAGHGLRIIIGDSCIHVLLKANNFP
jgi:hypothetical protein